MLKPLQHISEYDIVNGMFALDVATGQKGTPVVIVGSGWHNSATLQLHDLPGVPNSTKHYSKRWVIRGQVRAAGPNEKPFGVQMYDVKEENQFGTPLLYDVQRRVEAQCVLSGEAVPIARKGLLMVHVETGVTPSAGKFAVVGAGGRWDTLTFTTGSFVNTGVFGEWIGPKDNDGYAPVMINCWAGSLK